MKRSMQRAVIRPRRSAGFSLLEVMVATAILAVGALILTASIASSDRMNAIARERSITSAAIRAYLEDVRRRFPAAQNSTDMTGFFTDTQTPVNFLATAGPESRVLRDVECYVAKIRHEGPSAGSTFASIGDISLASGTPAGGTITADDIAALGLPREIDGKSATSGALLAQNVAVTIPVKIEIRWTSGSGGRLTSANKQSMVVYAIVSTQH